MGYYVNNNLVRNEQVEYEAKNHWKIFISLRALLSLFILPLIDMKTDEYVITNKRVIIKVGLIKRHTLEMNLDKIETVAVSQSILGRILGYGTITIIGTGGTTNSFRDISKPVRFRKAFQNLSNL